MLYFLDGKYATRKKWCGHCRRVHKRVYFRNLFSSISFFFSKGIVLAVLLEALENEEKNLDGYCIDGYPRTIEQLDEFKQKVT